MCHYPLSTRLDRQSQQSAQSMTFQTSTTMELLTIFLYMCELMLTSALPPSSYWLLVWCSHFYSFSLNFTTSVRRPFFPHQLYRESHLALSLQSVMFLTVVWSHCSLEGLLSGVHLMRCMVKCTEYFC